MTSQVWYLPEWPDKSLTFYVSKEVKEKKGLLFAFLNTLKILFFGGGGRDGGLGGCLCFEMRVSMLEFIGLSGVSLSEHGKIQACMYLGGFG